MVLLEGSETRRNLPLSGESHLAPRLPRICRPHTEKIPLIHYPHNHMIYRMNILLKSNQHFIQLSYFGDTLVSDLSTQVQVPSVSLSVRPIQTVVPKLR